MKTLTMLCFCAVAAAQQRTQFEGREALVVENERLALTVLPQGVSMVDLVLRDDPEKLSPMWNPVRMAREAGQKPPSGAGMGHFVCVDGFGPVSAEEQAAGLQGHGEAHRQVFDLRSSGKAGATQTLSFRAKLPLVEEVLTRTLRLVDGENVIYVESELENLLAFDRPVCWAEHATIGSPFLEPLQTVVDMAARRARTRPHEPNQRPLASRLASFEDFTWPMAPLAGGALVDLRAPPASPNSLDHTTALMDPSRELVWVTALHLQKRLLIGYVFRRSEFPWLQTWEHYPANLKMARGLEFSTQPFDVPRREAIDTRLFDTPSYRWLPAKSKIGSRFLLFYTRAPEGMRRVDDVTLTGGQLVIEDRTAGKRIVLGASLGLPAP